MLLDSLRVVHLSKKVLGDSALEGNHSWVDAFHVDTCQRQIWILNDASHSSRVLHPGIEMFSGRAAYGFLLRVATGLESEIVGETDIFGQIKEAWNLYRDANRESSRDLSPWIQKLFEDTKEIRTHHLQNIGGTSYGTLVRKLLRSYASSSGHLNDPILLVGAGQIARSVAPFLTENEVWIINRTPKAAFELAAELSKQPGARIRVITPDEEPWAWQKAAHAVICVPSDAKRDEMRVLLWNTSPETSPRAMIHLGGLKNQLQAWKDVPHFHSLDDLFALEKRQNTVRATQYSQARKACEEKAALRSLGGHSGATLAHGWEDLALFA